MLVLVTLTIHNITIHIENAVHATYLQQASSLPCHLTGGECGVPFIERFDMPYDVSMPWWDDMGVKRNPLWYSFDQGPIHFLSFTTELDFSPGSPQYL